MLATYQKPTDAPTGPTKAAVTAYRRMVQSNQDYDYDVSQAAWKCQADYQMDKHTHAKRQDATYILDTTIPAMERELADLRAASANEKKTGQRLIAEFTTIAELAAALTLHVQEQTPGQMTESYARARELAGELGRERTRAMNVLRTTSSPDLARRLATVQSQITDEEQSIKALEELVNIEERIAKQEGICNSMAVDARSDEAKRRYREQRQRLAELCGLRGQRAEAEAAVADRRQRLAGLRGQAGAIEAERLIVANQEWAA